MKYQVGDYVTCYDRSYRQVGRGDCTILTKGMTYRIVGLWEKNTRLLLEGLDGWNFASFHFDTPTVKLPEELFHV